MNILLSRSAEQDLLAGHGFYEKQATGIGTYFLDSLFADIDSLVLYAGIHPKPDGRFHRALAKRFPYAIYYRLADTTVTVVAVLDCRRQPGRNRRTLLGRQ
jgi:plasmid stabilization system protein ParE